MAREPVTNSTADAPAPSAKRTRKSGPRTPKPQYLLVNILDGAGNPVQGGSVAVLSKATDIDSFVKAQAANPGATLLKISADAVAKEGGSPTQE